MSLRVGYVNVQGLSSATWDAVCTLLGRTFDYLFLAETWYVHQGIHSRDRRVVVTTPESKAYRLGRLSGGIYLLATQEARARLKHQVVVNSCAISFTVGRHVVTGVYFPPSLSNSEVEGTLSLLSSSTIILGDINTRFRNCSHQSGKPGPPDRLTTFSKFLQPGIFTHSKPDGISTHFNGMELERLLTVDHCFVRKTHSSGRLRLLKNTPLDIKTDHKYTIHFTLYASIREAPTSLSVRRYRISRLSSKPIAEVVPERFDHLALALPTWKLGLDVDELNTLLVGLCQTVAEDVLGLATPSPSGSHSSSKKRKSIQQTGESSVRLYKEAATASKENEVILPTEAAQNLGVTAIDEISDMLKTRYQEPAVPSAQIGDQHPDEFATEAFTTEEIATEIRHQDSSKACGADGIHTRFLKALVGSSFLEMLQHLYGRCLATGKTPAAWNETDIYMLAKDVEKRRDANNVRPITLICMFRKVFERLLLLRFDNPGWANLHPAQAGFRSHYSTCMNAGVVHHLLASRRRSTAVFLDFRAAFDVVNHEKLATLLDQRGCPRYLQSLIASLMFHQVKSRVLVNGAASDWFHRTRGVLQGSPLSPCLFNIFIDSLLGLLNADFQGPPICLFYADDGVLLTPSTVDVQALLNKVHEWSLENAIELNVKKCGHISSRFHPPSLFLGGEQIPLLDSYDYLGFPVTSRGIDFAEHLRRRVTAACKRTRWLSLYSDSWGPAHRLRIYKQYLAPMFEYGAPLTHAWASENVQNGKEFLECTAGFKVLMAWVAHNSGARYNVTANLCGLVPLSIRFQQLRTLYQLVLDRISSESPLRRVFDTMGPRSSSTAFAYYLRDDSSWYNFKRMSDLKPNVKAALRRYIRAWHLESLSIESQGAHLTALIPIESRKVPGLFRADISLSAPMPAQEMLFQYRHGMFMFNSGCICEPNARFQRGHETCHMLPHSIRLTKAERLDKAKMQERFQLTDGKLTDVDYLLNTARLIDSAAILSAVKQKLRQIFSKSKLATKRMKEQARREERAAAAAAATAKRPTPSVHSAHGQL